MLPFEDISQQNDNEHICDGMTIDLIGKLTRIQNLKVIDWNSVKRYKNKEKDIREIGSELDVATLLTGSIQKEKDMIKVNAHLTKVKDRSQLWAKSYTRQFESILDLQDEISKVIAEALEVNFTPQSIEAKNNDRPKNIDAYDYRLRGTLYNGKFGVFGNIDYFTTSEEFFKQSISLDPTYADAYACLADLYNTYFNLKANSEAEKDRYLKLQERYLNKALDLNPNTPLVQMSKFYVLRAKGEIDKSFEVARNALEKYPNHLNANTIMGYFMVEKGLYYLAIDYYTKSLELSPFEFSSIAYRGKAYIYTGNYKNALIDLTQLSMLRLK